MRQRPSNIAITIRCPGCGARHEAGKSGMAMHLMRSGYCRDACCTHLRWLMDVPGGRRGTLMLAHSLFVEVGDGSWRVMGVTPDGTLASLRSCRRSSDARNLVVKELLDREVLNVPV